MSNLAQANIYKPQALSVEIQQFRQAMICWISGPYNTYRIKFPLKFSLEVLKKKILLKQTVSKNAFFFYQTHTQRHLQMLYQQRSLLHVYMNNWIVGNLVGFQKALRVRGVGYKFDISSLKITIQAGYSHLLLQKLPLPLYFQSIILNKKAVKIYMQGSNLMRINLYLAAIRNLRQPDVYKGKGLRYQKEVIMRKEGKKKKKLVTFMARLNQLIRKERKPRTVKNKRPNLQKCPQKKATCLKILIMTPRKPNSALRKVAWVLLSNFHRVHAYIPGMGGHTLQKHSVVLIRGGRVKDLPGIKYTIIRGKFDLKRIYDRRSAPSKYGAKKIYNRVDHRYRKYKYW